MSHRRRVHLGLLLTLLLAFSLLAPAAFASNSAAPATARDQQSKKDNLNHPLGDKQSQLRARGLEKVLKGQSQAKGANKVVQVAKGQYVELARQGQDRLLTIIGEFGSQVDSRYGGSAGPLHNQIPQPDRSVDNSTIWRPDFSPQYYKDMMFSQAPGAISMANYFIEQSSNRYSVEGEVSNWVQVPFNGARYGNNACGGNVCSSVWLFLRDSANAWYNQMIASGMTAAQVDAYLAQFDQWDRYDYDGDGNFNEPDGYIDHFLSVHAGDGEETGGGVLGDDAIWSHRWYAFFNLIGSAGPAFNKLGGIRVGNSNLWIGDYTIEPENGGVGVFSHEFGHDLGLPDLYDTSGNVGGAENSTGFWTLYSSGSYGNDGTTDLGTKPTHLGAYEKIVLGWSNYQVVGAGQHASLKLGPAEYTTKQAQQLVVLLPDKQVTSSVGAPYAGGHFYYSGAGDDLDNVMYKQVTLPAGSPTLTAKARYAIEVDWDYAYVVVSTDGGQTWNGVPTNLSTNTSPNGQNFGNGITGSSNGQWVDLTADLSAYAGQTVLLGFRYWTDGATVFSGFAADEVSIAGGAADGAEANAGWTFAPQGGFRVSTGSEVSSYFNAYLAEYRQYTGYDDALRTGPYNYGFLDNPNLQNWVEHFRYQDGLLIWYYDTSFSDNGVGDHPGGGLVLPIDAHPVPLVRPDGQFWRPRIQAYDSTFGLEPTDSITLHRNSVAVTHPSLPAAPVFNDLNDYWFASNPWASVQVPKTGTIIEVQSQSAQNTFMQVDVRPAR